MVNPLRGNGSTIGVGRIRRALTLLLDKRLFPIYRYISSIHRRQSNELKRNEWRNHI